jgi:hypothetical protein
VVNRIPVAAAADRSHLLFPDRPYFYLRKATCSVFSNPQPCSVNDEFTLYPIMLPRVHAVARVASRGRRALQHSAHVCRQQKATKPSEQPPPSTTKKPSGKHHTLTYNLPVKALSQETQAFLRSGDGEDGGEAIAAIADVLPENELEELDPTAVRSGMIAELRR